MTPVDSHETRLILDYCLGQATESESAQAERLISKNPEATEMYLKIKAALTPLENVAEHCCPDALVDKTVNRLNILARASQQNLNFLSPLNRRKQFRLKITFGATQHRQPLPLPLLYLSPPV